MRLIYADRISTFKPVIEKVSFSTHHKNLPVQATEMFRIIKSLLSDIFNEIFSQGPGSYNLCTNNNFKRRQVYSVYHGTKWLCFLGLKNQNLKTFDIKLSEVLKFRQRGRSLLIAQIERAARIGNMLISYKYLLLTSLTGKTAFYSIQYKNLLKQKLCCFQTFSFVCTIN